MKWTVWLSAVFLLAAQHLRASDPRATELVGLMTMTVRATTEQLRFVQHLETARQSADALGQLDKYLAFMLAEEKRVKVSNADPGALKLYEQAVGELEPEWKRIASRDELKYVLDRMPTFRRVLTERAGGRPGVAAEGVRGLTAAAQAYEIRFGQLPERLEQLVAPPGGGPPLIERDALTDPWGRPYRYDPAGPQNAGVRPDVWSLGPDPNDPKGVISNWQSRPGPKDGQ
jgi:hypothetical protein